MDLENLIPIFGILLVMIPVAGLTLVLTLRLAVKPLVETLARAVRESGGGIGSSQLSERVVMLEGELEALAQEVRQLRSAQEFDQQFLSTSTGGQGGP